MLCPALESKKNDWNKWEKWKTVRIKQMLWGKGWSCTPCSGRAKAAQRCSQSGRLFPWQSSETRNQQARPSFSQANQHQVPDFPLYLQQSIYVHGLNHTEVEHVLLHLSKHQTYFFYVGSDCYVLSCPLSKVHPCYFFGLSRCLGYHTTLSTHPWSLENMQGGLRMFVGDRNIMTFWLEMVRLSWSVNTAHELSHLMNLYYIWSEVWV